MSNVYDACIAKDYYIEDKTLLYIKKDALGILRLHQIASESS